MEIVFEQQKRFLNHTCICYTFLSFKEREKYDIDAKQTDNCATPYIIAGFLAVSGPK